MSDPVTDPRIQTISRGLIGAQQLQFLLRQKSDRDYVYEQLLPDARIALDSLAADLEAAREALRQIKPLVTGDLPPLTPLPMTMRCVGIADIIDAALARFAALQPEREEERC